MTDGAITLKRLERATLDIPISGVTPLIPHRWSDKARQMPSTAFKAAIADAARWFDAQIGDPRPSL